MEFLMLTITAVILGILIMALFGDEGYFVKKRIESYLDNIKYYQGKNGTGSVSLTYKGKEFSIRVECVDDTRYYKSMMLYINEEDVLSLHILIGDFVNCRTLWYHSNRNKDEVCKIIKAANKMINKKIHDWIEANFTDKSYFE